MTKQELYNIIIENINTNDAGLITGLVLQQVLLYLADYSGNKDELMELFLSKLEDDTAQGFIEFLKGISVKELAAFLEGIEVGPFSSGPLGSGAAIKMVNGTSYAEVDHLTVRQRATFRELIIEALKHVGGQLVLTPARMKCVRVVEEDTFYKCYFDTGDGEVSNEFVAGDLARCQVFTGSGTKFYWRLVTLVGEDWINLSKTIAAEGSDAPEAGDDIVQLGNATDTERQSAIILSTVGADAPSWKQYSGINSFSLEGKETTVFTRLGNRIQGKTVFTSGGANLDDHLDGVAQDILDALQAAQEAEDKAQQAIADAEANVTLINQETAKLQQQIDGEISNYYQPYKPTLSNYPASEWTTDLEKDRHIGDLFLNIQEYVDDETTPDAGKVWRFIKDGTTYLWTPIADSDSVKAMKLASQAQATADGKSTTFLIQPTSYKLGDMWVLNADRTVNGTAYKQGEILTATQDSATFNEAHWLKRVRYTDQDAIDKSINELEVGGRNLITDSTNINILPLYGVSGTYTSIADSSVPSGVVFTATNLTRTAGNYAFYLPLTNSRSRFKVTNGERVTVSFYIKTNVTQILDAGGYNLSTEVNSTWKKVQHSFIYPSAGNLHYLLIGEGLTSFEVHSVKMERGNKATDWTPAPEDVQAEIDTAKQEALTAAGNAQTTANSLKDFTDTAFRDGIINRSESVAIEKYKNSLNEAMAKAEASYDKVFKNTYLPEGTAKTSLLNAKVNLWGQRDTLLSTINTAISGGITTPTQKTAVDNAFNTFNSLMTAFQKALEEANKAIQAKLDAISKGYVDELAVGGANLVQALSAWTLGAGWQLISDTLVNTTTSTFNHCQSPNFNLVAGKRYVITAFVEDVVGRGTIQIHNGITSSITELVKKGDNIFEFTAVATEAVHIRVYGNTTTIYKIKNIVVRNIGVQERIDISKLTAEQAQLAADGYMRARYVRDWSHGSDGNPNANHWREIEVVNKSGINLAKNKVPTTNGTPHASYPLTNATDGDINTTAINGYDPSVGASHDYIQIDLGQVYYDIDFIRVIHSTVIGRTYFGTKTEISEDGVNWTTIFDSAVEGTYTETAEGKIHSQRYNTVLAKLNQSKAITDKFKTTIDGGLINTVMVELREADTQDVTAGHSGIQGALKNLPAYWAGGTYANAIAGIAKAIIRHDGTVKFTDAEITGVINALSGSIGHLTIEELGRIVMKDPATAKERLIFANQNIPTVSYLEDQTQDDGSRPIEALSVTTGVPNMYSSVLSVTQNGSTLTFGGTTMNLQATAPIGQGVTVQLTLTLERNSTPYLTLGSVNVYVGSGQTASDSLVVPPMTWSGLPSGNYRVKLERTYLGTLTSLAGSSTASTLSWVFSKNVEWFQFGLNGMMSWWQNVHAYFSNSEISFRAPSDKFDAPGVLAAGSSTSGGVQSKVWGPKSSTINITPITGGFRVPLSNMKHSNYVVQITPHTATTFRVDPTKKTSSSFEVYGSGGFDYVVIGNNYE